MSWAKDFAEAKTRMAEELERAEREAIASGKERFDLAKLELLLNRGPQSKREAGYRASYYSDAELRTLAEFAAQLLEGEPWHNTWWGMHSDTARQDDDDDLQLALQKENYRESLACSPTPVASFLRAAGAFAEAVHADDDYIEKGLVITARGDETRRGIPPDPALPFHVLAPLLDMGSFARMLVARHPSTPEATLLELLDDPDHEVSAAVRVRPASPPAVLERIRKQDAARPAISLVEAHHAGVERFDVARHPSLTPDLALACARDENANVRAAVAANAAVGASILDLLIGDRAPWVRAALAKNERFTRLAELATDPSSEVRRAIAKRDDASREVLELLASDDDESIRLHVTAMLNALPSIRARFHLPYNRRYGFGGEFPLKLLFIDDFTGRPDPRPLEDRIAVSVTTATFEKRMRELRPADAATRARWDELHSVIAAVEGAHPAALMDLWNASLVDLRGDFDDASELSRSGLARLIDAGIYNWPCCAASPPYSALVFGYPLQGEVMIGRSVFDVAERLCTPLVGVDDVATMARDIERTGWTLNPYGSDKRADLFAAWSLLRYLFMLHCHYRARREGLAERMQMWLDMHATHRQAADPTRPLLDATATLEAGDVIHLEATLQPPPGVPARKVEARAKLPYVEEGRAVP